MSKNDDKDENLKIAYNNYADELYEKKDYDKAEEYYKKSGNVHGLINTYFAKEDYNKAAEMIDVIPKEDELYLITTEKYNIVLFEKNHKIFAISAGDLAFDSMKHMAKSTK